MKTTFFCSGLLALALMAGISCHKNTEDTNDQVAPVVQIVKPASSDPILQQVDIEIQATDELALRSMRVTITKNTDGTVIYDMRPPVEGKTSFTFKQRFQITPINMDTPATLHVEVEDTGGNVTKLDKALVFGI